MNLIYFIGIKGTGMAALACMLHDLGHEVLGSDLEKHFFTEDPLRERGITILPFDADNIPDHSTVIIGNAFLEDFEEVKAARSNPTVTCFRYHEYLGELMKNYRTVCVSGSVEQFFADLFDADTCDPRQSLCKDLVALGAGG